VIGRRISHYYVIRHLGSGGMGVVYEAQDTRLPRSVAMKILNDEVTRDLDAVRRFKREARLASSLNHPNICTILDVSDNDTPSFIAMELLEGLSLKARLLGGPLRLDEIVAIASQVISALAAAHDQDIMHRDITPANIFVTTNGLVKLLDFGLAKEFSLRGEESQVTDELSSVGTVAGTIHYMSPEQLSAERIVDQRCDLYALGVVLYQMATGARPFDIQPRHALIAAIQGEPHLPLRQLAPHHPVFLEQIVDRLLAKDPADRYQSAAELRGEIDTLARRPSAAFGGTLAAAGRAIAVLPFDLIGPADPVTLSFRDGLAADIAARLSRLEGLSVASRTSTLPSGSRYGFEIGQRPGVDLLLEGTVQRSSCNVRVTATLFDSGRELSVGPSVLVTRPFDDPLATQEAIARDVCDAVARLVPRAAVKQASADPDAYHAYKRGQHLWKTCFEGGWRSAIEHFQHAIARDPAFAPAHVALASAYNFLGFYALIKPSLAFAVAGRAAEQALTIDPALASAFTEVGLARFGGEWDWEGAEQAFRRSLELDSTNPLAHVHYSWLLMLLRRDDAALREAAHAYALAPSSRLVAGARAQTLYLGGRYEEAIALCDESLRADSQYVFSIHVRGLCHLATFNRPAAVADLEHAASLSRRAPFYLGILGRCYGEFGMREEAMALINELRAANQDTYIPPQCYVFIYAGLGERDRALEFQERAYEEGASPFNYLSPCIRALYALSPHHKKRLEQMRLIL
jgi:tetratricopeptide (TPR) repeat protein/TolB-like protein/tRNA A-37 threonylcarbamoyl transferase component Bud32